MLAHAGAGFQLWRSNFETRTGEVLKAPAVEVASLNLRPSAVAQIGVCGSAFKGEAEKAAIDNSLNASQWFEPKHGGWRKPTAFTVELSSGETLRYSVALYRSARQDS